MQQWKWSKANPKDLAKFIDRNAIRLLDKLEINRFDLSHDSDGRRKLVKAIYNALVERNINYAYEQYQPIAAIQIIRAPHEILRIPGEGTCLDLAALFCGLCLGCELVPQIVIIEGHALAMVSLNHSLNRWNDEFNSERNFFNTAELLVGTDSLTKLTQLIDEEAYLAIECTGFAHTQSFENSDQPEAKYRKADGTLSFDNALSAGRQQLENTSRSFQFVIDIAVAHYAWQIDPLAISDISTNAISSVQINHDESASDGAIIIGENSHGVVINQGVDSGELLEKILDVFRPQLVDHSSSTDQNVSVNELVQQVRTYLHDSIQRLHSMMPLWGIDRSVPLGDLFVSVNILDGLSSNNRSELDDLWENFKANNATFHSFERLGLGQKRERSSGLAILDRNKNLMVVGKPGSGKTTYLQRIVTECNTGVFQPQRIPTLIKLRNFVTDGYEYDYGLVQFLGDYWQLNDVDTDRVLNDGSALILLDGLDEAIGEAGKKITREIKKFVDTYPKIQVVVTCRTQSQESRFDHFDYIEVADFNEKQVTSFVTHWFKTICGDIAIGELQAEEFLEQLFRDCNKQIRELAITPILLSLTCAVFYQTGKFYKKRSKLYEEGLELLLRQWDQSREIERGEVYRDLSTERKLDLLSHLAAKKFEQSQYILFERTEIEEYIEEFLGIGRPESRAVLKSIEAQHGLLIERANKIWSFSHLTFQEYLIAKSIVRNLDSQSQVQSSLLNFVKSHWREVYLLTAEMSEDLEHSLTFIRSMRQEVDKAISTKVNEFLMWIEQKSLLNHTVKASATRAFYLSSVLSLGSGLAKCIDSSKEADREFSRIRKIEKAIKEITELSRHIKSSYKSDRDLSQVLETSPKLRDKLALLCNLLLNQDLIDRLQCLIDLLPELSNGQKVCRWYRVSGAAWFYDLGNLVSECESTSNLQPCEQQLKELTQYHHANQLLIDCLNCSQISSAELRTEIEATLLLPISVS